MPDRGDRPGGHRARDRRGGSAGARSCRPTSTTRPWPRSRTCPSSPPASSPPSSRSSPRAPWPRRAGPARRHPHRGERPRLWTQILAGNAAGRARRAARGASARWARSSTPSTGSSTPGREGSLGTLSRVLEAGNLGHARIPGKHGAAPAAYESCRWSCPTSPARWPGCSPTSARPASTSRTSTSSTGSGSRRHRRDRRRAPAAARGRARRLARPRLSGRWRLHG